MNATKLIDALEALEYKPYSYSGRGMFGGRCIAINLERGTSPFTVGAQLVKELEEESDGEESDGEVADLSVAQDQMGLGTVLYFTGVPWPDGRQDGSEPDEG